MPALTETQAMMVATAEAVAQRFGPEYWREHDENEAYPEAFVSALGEHGFFGVTVPEALGGSGQGLSELVLVMEALCRGGGLRQRTRSVQSPNWQSPSHSTSPCCGTCKA